VSSSSIKSKISGRNSWDYDDVKMYIPGGKAKIVEDTAAKTVKRKSAKQK